MLSSVSWQQYFIFLLIANSVYYLFIWVVFYKAQWPSLVAIGKFRPPSLQGGDEPDEVLTTAQYIIDELKPLFAGKSNRNELVMALQATLRRYNSWEEPGFRETINQFIARESETTCSIRLGEPDFRALWS